MSSPDRASQQGEVAVNPLDDKRLMGRIAAAIWGATAGFGFIATIDPIRAGGEHVAEMRSVAASAAVIGIVLVLLPRARMSKGLFNFVLVLMSLHIGALAWAGGVVRGDLTMLFTFVVVFAAYFFSWRAAVAHITLIAAILASRLFIVTGADATRIESLRLAILLPSLVIVAGLVSILKKSIHEREAHIREQERYDRETGLLTSSGLDWMLDTELSRSRRHARPLSLILFDVSGPAFARVEAETGLRVATAIARSVVGRIRAEDKAAWLGDFRFAVIAVETSATGAAALAASLTEQVRKRIVTLGYESRRFWVAVGWSDNQGGENSKADMLRVAEDALRASALANEAATGPPRRAPAAAGVTRPLGAR